MEWLFNIIAYPFGYLMRGLYLIFSNYALSIIFFTIIIRVILLPLSIKQQKSSVLMAKMRPYENKIRAKYKNDPQKAQEELNAFYQSEGYSPFSGCLTSLIQLPILLGLYQVLRFPLRYIVGLSSDFFNSLGNSGRLTWDMEYAVRPLSEWGNDLVNAFNAQCADKAGMIPLNLRLFGLNLADVPSIKEASWLWLFPIFSGLTALALQLITMKINEKNAGGEKQKGMGMMLFMPVISVVIAFSVPCALVFYWIVSNLVGIAQAVILNKIYTVEKVTRLRAKKKAKKGESITREEAEILIKNEDYTVEEIGPKSAKELKEEARRKLAEARRREEEEWKE